MKTAFCTLKSTTPYSQSQAFQSPKKDKETAEDYEVRVWKERCHVTAGGHIFIPPMAFKFAIADAAKFLSEKIPGKRNATYTKHFESGILVMDQVALPDRIEDIEGEWYFVNADGRRGSGTRVRRCFPVIPEWEAIVPFHILDETITEEVFERTLKEAGNFIGIGRFRPRNGGFYGRFTVENVDWQIAAEQQAA